MFRDWSSARKITLASFVAVTLVYAWFIWQRRWISDDGMIYMRTVRQILEGNGPTFNAFERAESNTSTLWIWILAALGVFTDRYSPLAVFTGAFFSLAGFVIAMDATRRLLRMRGSTAPIVPAGALVLVGAYPFWDYATSGLETGLAFRGSRVLVAARHADAEASAGGAIMFGLGPLVRPDLGVATVVLFIAAWGLERPSWRRTLALGAAAARAATRLRNLSRRLLRHPRATARPREERERRGMGARLELFPRLRAAVLALAAGGDPPQPRSRSRSVRSSRASASSSPRRSRSASSSASTSRASAATSCMRACSCCRRSRCCLPGFVLPLGRFTTPAIAALVAWAITAAIAVGDNKSHVTGGHPIEDERVGYSRWTGRSHPIRPEAFIAADTGSVVAAEALRDRQRRMIWQDGPNVPMNSAMPGPIVYVAGRLGTAGCRRAARRDGRRHARPRASARRAHHADEPRLHRSRESHPVGVVVRRLRRPGKRRGSVDSTRPLLIRAARHAMQCGELKELLASVREPMSASRFWANLTGSFRAHTPRRPERSGRSRAQVLRRQCDGDDHRIERVPVRRLVSLQRDRWQRGSDPNAWGHTSRGHKTDGNEWIESATPRRQGLEGGALSSHRRRRFPDRLRDPDLGRRAWITRVKQTGVTPKGKGVAMPFEWSPPDTTNRVRIVGNKLRKIHQQYVLQIGEIEIP